MKRTIAAFVLCLLVGFGFRYALNLAETARLKTAVGVDFAPFQVESAIAYAQVRSIAAGREDAGVLATATTADLSAAEQLSGGMETFLGWSLALKRWVTGSPVIAADHAVYEDNPGDAAWVRFVLAAWCAWLPPLIFLWLFWAGLPRKWALFGALLYVILPAAVARYTGQELLKGCFALPFVAAYLAFATRLIRDARQERWYFAAAALAAFAAAANWDMAQIVFGAWAAAAVVRALATGTPEPRRGAALLAGWLGLLLAAVAIPYGRVHGSLLSPVVLWLLPCAIVLHSRAWRQWRWLWVCGLGALWYGLASGSPFAGNYAHFQELIVAKLQFWNVKPADPGVLSFNQRFLWTPELHSADRRLVLSFFPGAFWIALVLTAVGVWYAGWRRVMKELGGFGWELAGLSCAFFVVFLYMVRFHELAALFVAPWLAVVGYVWGRSLRRWWSRTGLAVLLAVVVVAELEVSATRPRYYPPTLAVQAAAARLAREANLGGSVVLADLELGSLLAGYAGCALVVQPKFELAAVREEAQRYIELLYTGTEEELAAYCERHQVRYLFFRRYASVEELHPDSYRYMAAAVEIPPDAVIRLLDWKPSKLTRFRLMQLPEDAGAGAENLRIFRYVTANEREIAADLTDRALAAFFGGRRDEALRYMNAAYRLDPLSDAILETWFRLTGEAPPALRLGR